MPTDENKTLSKLRVLMLREVDAWVACAASVALALLAGLYGWMALEFQAPTALTVAAFLAECAFYLWASSPRGTRPTIIERVGALVVAGGGAIVYATWLLWAGDVPFVIDLLAAATALGVGVVAAEQQRRANKALHAIPEPIAAQV